MEDAYALGYRKPTEAEPESPTRRVGWKGQSEWVAVVRREKTEGASQVQLLQVRSAPTALCFCGDPTHRRIRAHGLDGIYDALRALVGQAADNFDPVGIVRIRNNAYIKERHARGIVRGDKCQRG